MTTPSCRPFALLVLLGILLLNGCELAKPPAARQAKNLAPIGPQLPAEPVSAAMALLAEGQQRIAEDVLGCASTDKDASLDVVFLHSACLRSRFMADQALTGWCRLLRDAGEPIDG